MEILGITIAAAGWVFLLGFVDTPLKTLGLDGVVSLHLLTIATNVIHLGYVVAVAGLIKRGFQWVAHSGQTGTPLPPRKPSSKTNAKLEDQAEIEALRSGKMFD